MRKGIIIGLVLLSVIGCMGQTKSGKEKIQELKTMGNQKEIYLAGGCFWGTEHFFSLVPGVKATEAGYANSLTASPSYREVCTGATGATETVRAVYVYSESVAWRSGVVGAFYVNFVFHSISKTNPSPR